MLTGAGVEVLDYIVCFRFQEMIVTVLTKVLLDFFTTDKSFVLSVNP